MQVTTIEEINPDLRTGDCYRYFCFSSTILKTERCGTYEEYSIDITASVSDTPEIHLWAVSKGGVRNVVEVKLFTTEYEAEERHGRNDTFYGEIDTGLASITLGSNELSFETVCRSLQTLADGAYDLNIVKVSTLTGDSDE